MRQANDMQDTPTLHRAAAPAQTASAASAATRSAATRSAPARGRLVVDAPMRMFHWLFALSFAGAWLTADGERWRALHVTLGYTMIGLLAFRVLYGLLGPRHAGLGAMWRRLAGLPAWLRGARRARSPFDVDWRQGQNLMMTLAVAALLVTVVPLVLSGYATFEEWGGDWLEDVHEFFGELFLALVMAHLAGIAGLSLLRRKNQALPMLTGRIAGAGPDLVKRNRAWLATLLLVAVVAFAAWDWGQAPDALVQASRSFG